MAGVTVESSTHRLPFPSEAPALYAPAHLIGCHVCDLLQRRPATPGRCVVRCRRCGTVLVKTSPRALEHALALSLAALLLLLVANLWPLLELDFRGDVTEATLASAALGLYQEGQPLLAVLVLLTVVAVPLLEIAALLYLLAPLALRRRPPGMEAVFRLLRGLEPWGMLEVFTLGVLVTVVKLGHTADVIAGPALFALFAAIFVLAWVTSEMERVDPWARLAERAP